MQKALTRRDFVHHSAASLAVAAAFPLLTLPSAAQDAPKRGYKKGIMWGTVGVEGSVLEKMKAVKAAGFDGAEMNSHMDVDEVLRARDEVGLEIPSVCCSHHWKKPLTDSDPAVRAESVEATKQALKEAKRYGATSILLVPGSVTKETSYADAYSRSQSELRKIIPAAEETGVKIALENVWNHFLLSPVEAARFVDEMRSPMVGWHFDAGNIVNYGWPEQWIEILGSRILKVHVKEFSRKKRDAEGLWKGFQVKLMEGDVDWPAVMKALDAIGYSGWAITEQGGGNTQEGLTDLVERLDKILRS